MTHLNNEINIDYDKNSMENLDDNKKLSMQKELFKRRYEFLKITEL